MCTPQIREFVETGKKILGVGLNYRSFVASMNLPEPKEPLIFLKSTSSYITEGKSIVIPYQFPVNQEVELGVIIGKKGKCIPLSEAFDYVGGYCLALDLTAGDLMEARQKGFPWYLKKSFDTACPVSRFVSIDELKNPQDVRIYSKINGNLVQDSSTSDLIFSIPKLINYISQFVTLEPADLIITGSPSGAGPIKSGDVIQSGLGDILTMTFPVISAAEEILSKQSSK